MIRKMIAELTRKASARYPFGGDDFLQQVIGSAILTAPLLFTQEVWAVAGNTSVAQALFGVLVTMTLGYGILYVAEQKRDWETERKLAGIPLRYVSLMVVSYGTVTMLIGITSIPETFNAGLLQTSKVVAIISIFGVIGAATADSLI